MQNSKVKCQKSNVKMIYMKPCYLTFIFLFLILFAIKDMDAQTMIPKKCYMHFTGQVGKTYEVTMDMVKINDSVYADYQSNAVVKKSKANASPFRNYEKIQVLCGKMKPDGSFSLGVAFSKELPLFTGQLTREQKLTGTWENEDGKFPVEMKERYSDGSLQLNVSYLKSSIPLVKKPGSPKGSIEMAVLTPVESSNPLISDSLKKIMLEKFTKRAVNSSNPENNLAYLKQIFSTKYISSNEDLYTNKSGGQNLNWESLEFMHVLYNDKHFLTFYIISYGFTGGAHGLETNQFYVADLNTGKILSLSDLFLEDYEKELSTAITQRFKDMNSLSPGQQLTDALFFTDTVKVTDNFYLTGEGIGFFYNHYDIAPYADSPNSCFFTFSELKSVIRKDGALRSFLQ
jgi:hypothetical protein